MTRLSLRLALILGFSAVSVLMAILLSLSLGRLATDLARRDIGMALGELAGQMGVLLDDGLNQQLRAVQLITSLRQIRDPATPAGDNRLVLDKYRSTVDELAWIGFADESGKVLYSADGLLEGANVAARPWFGEGLRGAFVGDVHEAKLLAKLLPPPANGEPLRFVDVAAPVYGLSGQRRGVLGAHLSWEWARVVERSVFSPNRREQGVETFVLNRDNKVLMAPAGREAVQLPAGLGITELPDGEVIAWPDGHAYLTTVVRMRGNHEYSGLGWSIMVRQPVDSAYEPVRYLQILVLLIGVAMAVLFALFGAWLAGRITRPLVQLSDAADRLRQGEVDALIPADSAFRETRQLSSSLQHLVAALKTEQDKLSSLNASLEDQVADRTASLDAANRHLLQVLAERKQLVEQLAELASTDSLSGLLNRRAFHDRAAIELKRLERVPASLSVLIIDIDHFKQINDSYGHEAGDEAIRQLAERCRIELRDGDVLARFGGEEFVALLPDTELAAALAIAERLRAAIETIEVACSAYRFSMTASVGVAQWEPALDMDRLLARADQALYRAKQAGRNRVLSWQAPD